MAAAFSDVPREVFIPSVLAEQGIVAVYRDEAFVTKRDPQGAPISSSSQPGLMAAACWSTARSAWGSGWSTGAPAPWPCLGAQSVVARSQPAGVKGALAA